MISVRWNATYIWSHSSVTSVRLHGKNRAKTNTADWSSANSVAEVYCSCPRLGSFFPSLGSSMPPSSVLFCLWFFLFPLSCHSPQPFRHPVVRLSCSRHNGTHSSTLKLQSCANTSTLHTRKWNKKLTNVRKAVPKNKCSSHMWYCIFQRSNYVMFKWTSAQTEQMGFYLCKIPRASPGAVRKAVSKSLNLCHFSQCPL